MSLILFVILAVLVLVAVAAAIAWAVKHQAAAKRIADEADALAKSAGTAVKNQANKL